MLFSRLPEPTPVLDLTLKGYLHQLLRVLKFNFQDLDTEFSNLKGVTGLTTLGDVEVQDSAKGIILESPNGTRWRVQVSDLGVLTTTSL